MAGMVSMNLGFSIAQEATSFGYTKIAPFQYLPQTEKGKQMSAMTMTTTEYNEAFNSLGLTPPNWVNKLGISTHRHNQYSDGTLLVPKTVACHIKTLKEAKLVQEALCRAIGTFSNP